MKSPLHDIGTQDNSVDDACRASSAFSPTNSSLFFYGSGHMKLKEAIYPKIVTNLDLCYHQLTSLMLLPSSKTLPGTIGVNKCCVCFERDINIVIIR